MDHLANLLPPNVLILLILSGGLTSLLVLGSTVFLILKLGSKFLDAATKIPLAIQDLKSSVEEVKTAVTQGFGTVSVRLDNLEHRMSTIEEKMPHAEETSVRR